MENRSISKDPPDRAWTLATWSLLSLVLAWLAWDALVAAPDFCMTDEASVLAHIDRALSTGHPLIAISQGSLFGGLLTLASAAWGCHLAVLHGVCLALLALQWGLLYRLAERQWGPAAGRAATLAAAISASTFLQAHALTAYQFSPLLALIVLSLAQRGLPWSDAAGGALLALGLLDYEGWIFTAPALAAYLWAVPVERRPRAAAWWGGLLVGLAIVFIASPPVLRGWLQYRLQTLPTHGPPDQAWLGLLKRLGQLFTGGGTFVPHLVVSQHPWFEPWAWPLLVAGLVAAWRRDRPLLALAGLSLLPLLIPSANLETNRASGAWPALALLCGLGWERLRHRLPAPELLLLTAAVLGLLWESAAFVDHQQRFKKWYYAPSATLRAFVRDAGPQLADGQARALTGLDEPEGGALRFLLRGLPAPEAAQPRLYYILFPREILRDLGPDVRVMALRRWPDQAAPLYIGVVDAAHGARFVGIDRALRALEAASSPSRTLDLRMYAAALDRPEPSDPIYRSIVWKRWTDLAVPVGLFGRAQAQRMLAEPFKDGLPFLYTAFTLLQDGRDPWLGWRMGVEYYRRQPETPMSPDAKAALAREPPGGGGF